MPSNVVDLYGEPRKVSKAFLLGFSNKPFKDPRPPAPPPPPRQSAVTTPGGVVVWLAGGDGRNTRLTGEGRLRLGSDAKKPSEKPRSSKSKHESMKAAEAVAGWIDGAADGWGKEEKKSKSHKSKSKKDEAEPAWAATGDWGETNAKSASHKSNSNKGDGADAWAGGNVDGPSGWDNSGADAKSNKSKSKPKSNKTASNKGDAWAGENTWGATAETAGPDGWNTTAGDDKKDETNVAEAWEKPTEDASADVAAPWDVPAVADNDEKKEDGTSTWTSDEDKKLMDLKTEDAKVQWTKVAEELGKGVEECKEHFKKIKPKDWKPNAAPKGGDGGGGKKGKEKKNKGKDHNQSGDKKNEKKEEKKEESSGTAAWDNPTAAGGDDDGFLMGGVFGADDDDKKDDTDKANEWTTTGNDGANDTTDAWGKNTGGGDTTGGGDATWGTGNDTSGDAGNSWDTNKQNNTTTGFDASNNAWPSAPKPASAKASSKKAPSEKPPSHKSSSNKPDNNTSARPLEYELKPDKDFTADELRVLARIMQQDYAMVWNRVSWRFKDKTGRTLHPDLFEKKITGKVEGKGSEKGERRR